MGAGSSRRRVPENITITQQALPEYEALVTGMGGVCDE